MLTFECPICNRILTVARRDEAPFRPFCSARCKLVDLGRWLDGTYAVREPSESGNQPTDGATETDAEDDV